MGKLRQSLRYTADSYIWLSPKKVWVIDRGGLIGQTADQEK